MSRLIKEGIRKTNICYTASPFSVIAYPRQGRGGLEPNPAGIGARGGIHPGLEKLPVHHRAHR